MKSVTYLLYAIWWDAMTVGGSAYVVFWLHRSPWWLLGGILLCSVGTQPGTWAALWRQDGSAK